VKPLALMQPLAPEQAQVPAFDPAGLHEALGRRILEGLHGLGYHVVVTQRSLFDAVSRDERRQTLILTGVGELEPGLAQRARALQSIGAVVEREVALFVRDRKAREELEGTAVIDQDELARMEEPGEVLDLIRERRRPASAP
jgi:predicted transcriptional regulator